MRLHQALVNPVQVIPADANPDKDEKVLPGCEVKGCSVWEHHE